MTSGRGKGLRKGLRKVEGNLLCVLKDWYYEGHCYFASNLKTCRNISILLVLWV